MSLRHRVTAALYIAAEEGGPVAYGATGGGSAEAPTDGIISWSHTCLPDDNIVFVGVGVGVSGAAPASYSAFTRSATFDGVPMTSLAVRNCNDASSGFVELYKLDNPPTGSAKTVQVSMTGHAATSVIGDSVSYSAVSSLGSPVTAAGVGAGTVTVSSATDHMVIGVFATGTAISGVTDTQRYLANNNESSAAGNVLIQDQTGATSAVLGYANNSDWFAAVAVDLVSGAGAPPGVPEIISIVPNPGPAGPVTVNGTDFIAGATLSFGGSAATNVVVVNSTQITCTAPAHADGAVDVTVTTSAGTSPNYSFTYQESLSGFVTRSGSTLLLDGNPYQSGGTNCYDVTGCHTGTPLSDATDDQFFAQFQPNTMFRVWGFEPQGITGLARTVASAEDHNQKLIVSLMDGPGDCGEPERDVAWYTGGYAASSTWTWITTVCNQFKDSTAIAMWEVGNEICNGCTPAQTATFLEAAAQRIRTVDTNHLICSGLQAPYMFDSSASQYAQAQNAAHIDVCSVHEYDYPYNDSRTIVSYWYTVAKQAADSISKPIIIGEIGISLATQSMTAQERADALVEKYDAYLGDGAAGAFYWICLGPPNNPGTNTGSLYGNIDPMIGGPVVDAIANYTLP